MRLALLLISIFALQGCMVVVPFGGPQDRKMHSSPAEGIWHAMNVIDMGQTLNMSDCPDQYREANFMTKALIGEHPSSGSVVASSMAYSLLVRWGSEWLERQDHINEEGNHDTPWVLAKWSWYTALLVTKSATIYNNHQIGLRPFSSQCNRGN